MREIKFRAWHDVNKVMYAHKDIPVLAKNMHNDVVWKYMQYIGTEDCDGGDICEYDILFFQDSDEQGNLIHEYGIVEYDAESAKYVCWSLNNDFNLLEDVEWSDFKILGNKYEHPHLLITEK